MLYKLGCIIVGTFLRLVNWKVEGAENVPKDSGVLIIANHLSNWDPIMVACAIRSRNIKFMAKEQLFNYPILKQLVVSLGAFPVKRGKADRQAIKQAMHLLKTDQAVGLFPEGTRGRAGQLQPFHSGAAMLGAKTKAAIVPVAITGSDKLINILTGKINVRIGPPIYYKDDDKLSAEKLEELNLFLQESVKKLLDSRENSNI